MTFGTPNAILLVTLVLPWFAQGDLQGPTLGVVWVHQIDAKNSLQVAI